ncbi:TPR domain [Brachionus plicatilis]|uniref:TPR domain n=1 Tax=Brachionus plicatilis TaxID=10195 RepID=A0A3M7QHW3_BRAPC|nr:TPR domain [Brachionus plicatilis]
MLNRNKFPSFLLFSACFIIIYFLFDRKIIILKKSSSTRAEYLQDCLNLYKKLRNPDKKNIFRPPLREPPKELYDEFTDNGNFPITSLRYFNNAYSDSASNSSSSKLISSSQFYMLLQNVIQNKALGYKDTLLNKVMHEFKKNIEKKSMAVIGTVLPWVEAIAYHLGSSKVSSFDYTRKRYNISRLEWWHVNDFLDSSISNNKLETFDNAASFSSIEHAGLGRFGDPLSPYGDVEAVQQVHCMLKPGGLFFLGLPGSKDGSSFLVFNAHRIYGKSRLKLLFKNWKLIREYKGGHNIFVLQKHYY